MCLGAVQAERRGRGGGAAAGAAPPVCAMCGAATAETEQHFLLECGRWAGMRRQLWVDLTAVLPPALGAALRDTRQRGQADDLLRILLEGDCSEFLPAGYHTRPSDRNPIVAPAPRWLTATATSTLSMHVGRFLTQLVYARRHAA